LAFAGYLNRARRPDAADGVINRIGEIVARNLLD
jgi:hypothetical protein